MKKPYAFFLAAIAATCPATGSLAQEGPARAPGVQKTEVTALVIREAQFTMSTTPAPVGPSLDLAIWLLTTRRRMEALADMAAALDLPYTARHAVSELRSFLEYYEQFRSDLDLIDFVVNVRMTEGDGSYLSDLALVADAAGGLAMGQSPADLINPIALKTLAAQVCVGGVCKGAAYFLRRWDKEEIAKSLASKLDKLKADEVAARVANFCARFKELDRRVKDLASQAEGAPISADDAFSWLQSAYEISSSNHAGAAEKLHRAAAALPENQQLGRAYYDEYYRAPSLFMAAVLYERQAAQESARAAHYLSQCIANFEAGLAACGGNREAASYEAVLAYCRALAVAGDRDRLAEWFGQLQQYVARGPDDHMKALRMYDCAAVCCLGGGEADRVFELLRQSYRQWPRRDPFAMVDPALAGLQATRRFELQQTADNPLCGGVWSYVSTDRARAFYAFYPGGALLQTFDQRRYKGDWEMQGAALRLTNRRDEQTARTDPRLSDAVFPLTFAELGNTFVLNSAGKDLVYTRTSGRRFSERHFAGITVSDDGSWRQSGSPPPIRARCVATMDFEKQAYTFTFMSELPVGGISVFSRTEEQAK